jgi:VWFA-related protein
LLDFVVAFLQSCLWRAIREDGLILARLLSLLTIAGLSSLLLAQDNSRPTFRSETTVVLVPTLVTNEHGEVIYGLTQKDFVIMDNGVERTVLMDDTFSSKPVSLVLAVQTGGSAPAVLGNGCALLAEADEFKRSSRCRSTLHEIGSMLETFVDGPGSEMALVSFDSDVKLRHEFTSDISKVNQSLEGLHAGDSGSAILDAIHYSLDLLRRQPDDHRKVLVVVSEQADGDSKTISLDEAAKQIIASDVELYMISFPADAKAKLESAAKLFGPMLQQVLLREEVASGRPHGMGGHGMDHAGGAGAGTPSSGAPRAGGAGGAGGHQAQTAGASGAPSPGASSGSNTQGDNTLGDSAGGPAEVGLSAATNPGVSPGNLETSSAPGYGLGPRNINIGGPILSLVRWSASQMHTNVPQAVANLTGGEYVLFHNSQGLDQALGMLANHAHNRYQLSFQVKDPAPGPHRIQVSLRDASGALIWARAGYWPTVNATARKANPTSTGSQKGD